MTSLKKPLIAIASAVALVTSALVSVPAQAATVSVALANTSATGTGTAADPFVIDVPADNTVATSSTAANSEAVELAITVDSGAKTTITSTGGVKLLQTLTGATSASGSQSLEITPASTTLTVYAFTTSTTAGTVTLSIAGATTTVSVKGTAGEAYNVSLTTPATGNIGSTVTATAVVTDIFGNGVATAPTFTAINSTAGAATAVSGAVGRYTSAIALPTTAGTASVGVSIATPTAVALATAKTSASALIAAGDQGAQIVSLQAELDKVKAELALANAAAAGNKAKYNNLAKKWNKKFPKAKVALIK